MALSGYYPTLRQDPSTSFNFSMRISYPLVQEHTPPSSMKIRRFGPGNSSRLCHIGSHVFLVEAGQVLRLGPSCVDIEAWVKIGEVAAPC